MTSFDDFYNSLQDLIKNHKDINLKIIHDENSEIIKISGDTTPLDRAKNGLEDVLELSYTAAEHHPFWNLLYQCSDISKTVLEKWNSQLSSEELDQIRWSIDELKNSCIKLKRSDS